MKTENITNLVNADFSQRVVLDTERLPWIPSPLPGVDRRLLDRIGGEVARATSLVRYAPDSSFSPHLHAMGEEFLVLAGIFSDEHGDYQAGTYVRNPPGSHHTPFTKTGCTILVKLRQMQPEDEPSVVIETGRCTAEPGMVLGHEIALLYRHERGDEVVTIETLAAGTRLEEEVCHGGEEIFVLSGEINDGSGGRGAGTWIRNPDGFTRRIESENGALFWRKYGHLTPDRLADTHKKN